MNKKYKDKSKNKRRTHAQIRAEQRYNLELNRVGLNKIVSKIIQGDCLYIRNEGLNEFYYVKHNNVPVKVLYNPEFRMIITNYPFDTEEYNRLIEDSKMKGKGITEPTRQTKTPRGYNRCEEVINITTGEVFKSGSEASRFYNIDAASISRACHGKVGSAGGYQWAFKSKGYLDSTLKDKVEFRKETSLEQIENYFIKMGSKGGFDYSILNEESENKMDNNEELFGEETLLKEPFKPSILDVFKQQLEVTQMVINTLEESEQLRVDIKKANEVSNKVSEDYKELYKYSNELEEIIETLEDKVAELSSTLKESQIKIQELARESQTLKMQLENPNTLLDKVRSFFK